MIPFAVVDIVGWSWNKSFFFGVGQTEVFHHRWQVWNKKWQWILIRPRCSHGLLVVRIYVDLLWRLSKYDVDDIYRVDFKSIR